LQEVNSKSKKLNKQTIIGDCYSPSHWGTTELGILHESRTFYRIAR